MTQVVLMYPWRPMIARTRFASRLVRKKALCADPFRNATIASVAEAVVRGQVKKLRTLGIQPHLPRHMKPDVAVLVESTAQAKHSGVAAQLAHRA